MSLFKGSGVALVTPFKDNDINYEKLGTLIDWHLKMGTDAIIVGGTTGEAATLSRNEQKSIVEFTVKRVQKRVPVIAGTGSNNTAHAIALSLDAKSAGADGLLVVTPYYNKTTQRGLYEHYQALASAVDSPIIIYNVPSRTGLNILPETVYKLSKIPNIIAIKEASGDVSQVADIAHLCAEDFAIYSGNDDQIVPIMSLGGIGTISVLANILPKETHAIVDNYLKGNVIEAAREQLALIKLIKALFIETNPIPIKTAMNMLGMEVGGVRLPLITMDNNNKQILITEMKAIGLAITND